MKHYTAAPGENNFIAERIIFCLEVSCLYFIFFLCESQLSTLFSLLFLFMLLSLVCYIEIILLHYIDHSPDYQYELQKFCSFHCFQFNVIVSIL